MTRLLALASLALASALVVSTARAQSAPAPKVEPPALAPAPPPPAPSQPPTYVTQVYVACGTGPCIVAPGGVLIPYVPPGADPELHYRGRRGRAPRPPQGFPRFRFGVTGGPGIGADDNFGGGGAVRLGIQTGLHFGVYMQGAVVGLGGQSTRLGAQLGAIADFTWDWFRIGVGPSIDWWTSSWTDASVNGNFGLTLHATALAGRLGPGRRHVFSIGPNVHVTFRSAADPILIATLQVGYETF